MPSIIKSLVVLGLFLAICYGASAVGGYFTSLGVSDWYPTLDRPSWTPSGRTIGAVWTILYGLMAMAAWLVWRQAGVIGAWLAMALFGVQLLLNVAWSAIFFTLREPGWAFIELLFLETAIIATLIAFWRITPAAGALLIPYALWVAFAGVLNFLLWRMNA